MIGQGDAVAQAMAAEGIYITGHRWQWAAGVQGGVFDPHLMRDGDRRFDPDGWVQESDDPDAGALPGLGVNRGRCMCTTKWILRGADGRFAKYDPAWEDFDEDDLS